MERRERQKKGTPDRIDNKVEAKMLGPHARGLSAGSSAHEVISRAAHELKQKIKNK